MGLYKGIINHIPSEYSNEVITAWRAWRLRYYLCSIAVNYTWKPGARVEALHSGHKCLAGGLLECSHCGFWAIKTLEGIDFHYSTYPVIGRVSLWGEVVEGEIGYRAQFAYPERLYVIKENLSLGVHLDEEALASRLREYYKVEVYIVERFEDILPHYNELRGDEVVG